jgi:hypothetical protein
MTASGHQPPQSNKMVMSAVFRKLPTVVDLGGIERSNQFIRSITPM